MSRRFGRNQRRKLREELRRAEEAQALSAELHRWTSARLHRAERTLRRVADIFGEHFIGLPAKVIDVERVDIPGGFRLPSIRRFSLGVSADLAATAEGDYAMIDVAIKHYKLAHELRHEIHVFIKDKADVRYTISEKAFLHRGLKRDEVARWLADEIANKLINHVGIPKEKSA